jgi:hypothetical protein
MKNTLILIFTIALFSCEDQKTCQEIIMGKPDNHLITDSELSTVKSMFKSNNLNLDNFQVYRLQIDDLGQYHVRCYQYVNNLKLLLNDEIFHFDRLGYYKSLSGEIIDMIDIEPSPAMDIQEVKDIFFQSLEKDKSYSGDKRDIEDGCIICELGYFNLNSGISYTSPDFRLAWIVRPDGSDYPFALIIDPEKALKYYDNGIRYITSNCNTIK